MNEEAASSALTLSQPSRHPSLTTITMSETGLHAALQSKLDSRVFHVTRLANLPSILASGQISPNTNGSLTTGFGSSENSFFRKRGCVSVFDLRVGTPEQIQYGLSQCSPTTPARNGSGIAIFFLAGEAYTRLLPWQRWKEEQAWHEMVVPYVEAGHQGPISIDLIDEILCVQVVEDPRSLATMIHRARSRLNGLQI